MTYTETNFDGLNLKVPFNISCDCASELRSFLFCACIPLVWFLILPHTAVLPIVLQHCNNRRPKMRSDKFIMIEWSWESCRVLVKTLSWCWGKLGKAEHVFLDRSFRSNRLNTGYDSDSLALFQLVQCSRYIIDSLKNQVTSFSPKQ